MNAGPKGTITAAALDLGYLPVTLVSMSDLLDRLAELAGGRDDVRTETAGALAGITDRVQLEKAVRVG